MLPLSIASKGGGNKTKRYVFAAILWPVGLLLFPLPFAANTWSWSGPEAGEGFKSTGARFGYEPFWQVDYSVDPAFTRYETTDLGQREVYIGNGHWGQRTQYGLNHYYLSSSNEPYSEKEMVNATYECVIQTTVHLLGYFWQSDSHMERTWMSRSELPMDRCTPIERPAVGAQIHGNAS